MADAVDMDKGPTEGHVLLSAEMKKRAVHPNPLNKLTGTGMFKDRLVVLRPKTITWYEAKGKDDRHPKGELVLNKDTLLEEHDAGEGSWAFMIETGGLEDDDTKREKLVLQCATKEEREKWKKQIRGQVKMLTEQAS